MSKCYLWQADQSEPGEDDSTWVLTDSRDTPPTSIEPTPVPDAEGLAFAESFYGDWKLVGEVTGELFENEDGMQIVTMHTPVLDGCAADIYTIVRNHWYKTIKD